MCLLSTLAPRCPRGGAQPGSVARETAVNKKRNKHAGRARGARVAAALQAFPLESALTDPVLENVLLPCEEEFVRA